MQEPETGLTIDLINKLEAEKGFYFSTWQEGKRIALAFGNAEIDITADIVAQGSLDFLGSEDRDWALSLFDRITAAIAKTYQLTRPLYICSFWFAKQYPGATIPIHTDVDKGNNPHFEHSVILYLSTLKSGGVLEFPDLEYSHTPEAGDLVFFPTQTTGEHYVGEIPEERYSLVFWTTYEAHRAVK